MPALVVVSLSGHAAVVAAVEFDVGGEPIDIGEAGTMAAVGLRYSCWADATLALGAQRLRCELPGVEREGCDAKAYENFRFDILTCNSLKDTSKVDKDAVAFMTAEEIDSIEPEQLADVEPIDEIEMAQLLEQQIEQKVEEAQREISMPQPNAQVVEVTAPEIEQRPDNARFMSEYDTAVEKETVARGSTEEMVERPAPKELPVEEDPKELPDDPTPSGEELLAALTETSVKNGTADEGVGDKPKANPLLAMRAQEFREELTAGEKSGRDALEANGLAAKKGSGERDQSGQAAREGQESQSGGSGARRAVPNLRPSEEMLSRMVGGGSVDKLDGVESGDFTALNSKKWKFASFFNRMKRQVAQNWHPDQVYIRRDPTGKVYGTKDRVTVLEVSLKPDGALHKVVVFQESGVDFLDAEAISAFEKAQPFPNPPSGLVDQGSQLITFSFGFHFQVGSRRDAWKIFRYN